MRDVRRTNRALLLRHLLFEGETNRSSLGEATLLSAASVTNLVGDLVTEGVVVERGQLDSIVGGRPRTKLAVNPSAAMVIGADVGEAEITIEAFDLAMQRLAGRTYEFSNHQIDPAKVTEVILEATEALVSELGVSGPAGSAPTLLGVGLGVPGIVEHPQNFAGSADPQDEPLVHAQVIGWNEANFSDLARRLGAPLLIDNGAKTTTQAEAWYGSARGVDHGVVVLIGDGVGSGIITNGRLFRGSSSTAGEWGHTKISLGGARCRCGARGCVETFVGASAVVKRWRGDAQASEMGEGIDEMFRALRDGDVAAVATVRELIDNLGVALSNLVNLYNPQKIVLAGWFGDRIAQEFLEEVRAAVVKSSLPQPGAEVVIERSSLGHRATALGAATLPLDRFIEYGWPRQVSAPHP